jgi:hypothetical protein
MIDYQRLFHTGVRVPDLDRAMADLGPSLGVTWAPVWKQQQPVWTPQCGPQSVQIGFTYSTEGPQHIELVQGEPGTIWDAGGLPGVHHVGLWADDVASEASRLIGMGWDLVAAQLPPDAGCGAFAYLAPPSGLVVEIVDAAVRPRFEAWWSAGTEVGNA